MTPRALAAAFLVALPSLVGNAAAQDAPKDPPPGAKEEPAAKVTRELATEVTALAISPDGRWIAAGDDDGGVVLFSTTTAERREAGRVEHWVCALDFSSDSKWVLAEAMEKGDGREVLLAADVATGKTRRRIDVSAPEKREPSDEDPDSYYEAHALPGGSRMELFRYDTVEIVDLATGERIGRRKNDDPWVQAKVRSADGALAALTSTGAILVVDGLTGARRFEIRDRHEERVGSVEVSNCSRAPVGFALGANVLLVRDRWHETRDAEPGAREGVAERTERYCRLVGVSAANGKVVWKRDLPDTVYEDDMAVGAEVAAVECDGKVTFVDCATGKDLEEAPATKEWTCVTVAPDGRTFWAGAEDGTVTELRNFPAPKAK